MAEPTTTYPWTANTGNLQEVLTKVQRDIYPPVKVTSEWLQTLGYKSSNDRSILRILEFIGFVDSAKQPTDLWKIEYRKNNYKQALAKGVMNGYRELFECYTNANQRTDSELMDFFAPRVKGGSQVLQKTVVTFKMLCSMSDFEGVTPDKLTEVQQTSLTAVSDEWAPDGGMFVEKKPASGIAGKVEGVKVVRGGSVTVNVTINLPATTDKEVYAAFFEALKAIMQ